MIKLLLLFLQIQILDLQTQNMNLSDNVSQLKSFIRKKTKTPTEECDLKHFILAIFTCVQ